MTKEIKELLTIAYQAVDSKHALDIEVIDMTNYSILTDYTIICEANTERQVEAIAKEIKDEVTKAGFAINHIEGADNARWILVDLGDVIVHIFHKEERDYYKLDRLYRDLPKVVLA